jgi:RNA polymerase sigma-70 factor, ECF subfamily
MDNSRNAPAPRASLPSGDEGGRVDPEALVTEFHARVQGYVRMRVPERDCEDVVGEIFLRAIERRAEIRSDAAAWLFAVARSQVARYHRDREAHMTAAAQTETLRESRPAGTSGQAALERLERAEFCRLLRATMDRVLSETERDVIAFKFTEGLGNAEIARILGLTPNNLGVVLHRALGRLRGAMLSSQEVANVVSR